ncbi:MAG: PEP-CTERM sorting domain-containing protein [Planctomycetota bacterium]|jgi:hypothetical protein
MKVKIITILATAMLLGLPVANGQIVVIDFEDLGAGGDDGPTYIGPTYSEDGFTLTTDNPEFGDAEFGFVRLTEPSTIALFGRYPDDVKTLTKNDGGTFDLLSIDYYPYSPNPAPIEFTGTLYDGTTIYQSFPPYEGNGCTLIFTDFTDLISMSWQGGGGIYVHFDDITIIPEPTTLLLFGLGVLLLKKGDQP